MKNKLQDMADYLFIMADRLLDNEVCADEESTKAEISKAHALAEVAQQTAALKDMQLREIEINLKALKQAKELGYSFKPELKSLEAISVGER